jgi:hypothetical protein
MDPDADPDLSIFIIAFQDGNKKQKQNLKTTFFLILLFEGIFTSFFEGNKSKRSHKTVELKVFLTIYT